MRGVGFSKLGTFHRASGPKDDPDRNHLFFICTKPQKYGMMLIVPMCSLKPYTNERTCLLEVGDHPAVEHRSYISYQEAEISDLANMQRLLQKALIFPDDDCKPELLERICDGLLAAKRIRPTHRAFFEESKPQVPQAA